MTGCAHGMPTPASCVDCMADGPVGAATSPARPLAAETPPFLARFPGRCSGCPDEIEPDDRIVRMTDETYRHVGCES